MKHPLLLTALILATTAGDCFTSTAMTVAPQLGRDPGESARTAVASTARVASRNELKPIQSTDQEDEQWLACFSGHGLLICEKARDDEIQMRIIQGGPTRFTPWAERVIRELTDSLTAIFGPTSVRTCQWRIAHGPGGSGCAPPESKRGPS